MRLLVPILSVVLVGVLRCASVPEREPSGPIARFGTTPTLDGVFDEGEWDDAAVVQADSSWQFRLKHDNVNLYLALDGAGGNLWLRRDNTIHVLHASFAVHLVEYRKSDSSAGWRSNEPVNGLYGLQNETAAAISEGMIGYLGENGWVGSLVPMGNMPQTEFAVSFEFLGMANDQDAVRFAEIPSIYVFSCLNLSAEELRGRAGWWDWPGLWMPSESLSRGHRPETITADAIDWGRIWIDFQK